jgi:elongator complex protein 3
VKKPCRSLSGVSVIAVMAPSFECPGRCLFCFRGPNAAQSYTGKEPSARRAIAYNYDPYEITKARLEQLERNGHPTDKLDVIVMGGTFNFYPREFQSDFVKKIYDACNGTASPDLFTAKKVNETAPHRIIGLTFETRPDWATLPELSWLLEMGATRIEMGAQSTFDDVLEFNRRGHGTAETRRATADAKDLGYKVCYHIMPGLPKSSKSRDIEMFQTLFTDSGFMPDMLKIYPTIVIPGSKLDELESRGEFTPIDKDEAAEIIARGKASVPPWARIMRIQRDVPIPEIKSGVKAGNLRELVWARMPQPCQCIRCREARGEKNLRPVLVARKYEASGAEEIFLSYEDKKKNKIVALLRLRLLKRFLRPELENSAMVREIRVFGQEARIGEKGVWQHRGFGRKLMAQAEKIAEKNGYKKVAVISGVGVREYFRKLGYSPEGSYMTKLLNA